MKTSDRMLRYIRSEKGKMVHLESLFAAGMAWGNYGEWHIDHTIADIHFDYSSAQDPEFLACWALNNLQPLWSSDNCSKGAKDFTLWKDSKVDCGKDIPAK